MSMRFRLTPEQRTELEKNGYVGPFPVVPAEAVPALAETLWARVRSIPLLQRQPVNGMLRRLERIVSWMLSGVRVWLPVGRPRYSHRSAHVLVPEIQRVGTAPELVERVASVLGTDLILWSGEYIRQAPGVAHRWHEDIEHRFWEGLTAWVALENVTPNSALRCIAGSHHFGVSPQDIGINLNDDQAVLAAAKDLAPTAEMVTLTPKPGEAVILAGRTWHATSNTTQADRSSLIFQYTRSTERVRIPLNFETPVQWALQQPPVLLVSGSSREGLNHVVRLTAS